MAPPHQPKPFSLQKEALVLVPPVFLTLWFHLVTWAPTYSDESVHLYVARRMTQGAVLYRDIDSARPPLALLPLVLGLFAKAPPLLVARLTVLLTLFATAFLLRQGGRSLLGPAQGTAAAALFLLAPEVSLRSAYTGIQLVALGSLGCVVLLLKRRALGAGLVGGLTLAAGQHAAIIVGGCFLWCLLYERKLLVKFTVGALSALVGVFGLMVALAGPGEVWNDLVAHHLYHLGGSGHAVQGDLAFFLPTVTFEHAGVLTLALVAVFWRRPSGSNRLDSLPTRWVVATLVLAHLLVVSLMEGGLVLYLFPAVPLLVLLASDGLIAILGTSPRFRLMSVGGLLVMTLIGWHAARLSYERRDRRAYALVPMLRQFEMARLQELVVLRKVEAAIRPMLREGDTLFGSAPLAAAVALDLNRRVSGEFADFALRWVQLGLFSRKALIETIEKDRVRVVVTHAGSFDADPVFHEYLSRCYRAPLIFERETGSRGSGIPPLSVFEHLESPCLAGQRN